MIPCCLQDKWLYYALRIPRWNIGSAHSGNGAKSKLISHTIVPLIIVIFFSQARNVIYEVEGCREGDTIPVVGDVLNYELSGSVFKNSEFN